MKRGITGRYIVTSVGGENIQAFIPNPLPPNPPLAMSSSRRKLLEHATLAIGRLDSITLLLPDPNLFLYAYIRREAVLSSQIRTWIGSAAMMSAIGMLQANRSRSERILIGFFLEFREGVYQGQTVV